MGIRQGFKDFCNGVSVIVNKPKDGDGDRALAKISLMVEAQINSHTKNEIRRRVINDIEHTLKSESRKGGKDAVDRKVELSLATPEWVHMIHRLGLDESHIRLLAIQAVKNEN